MLEKTQEEIMKKWPALWTSPMVTIRCLVYNHGRYISQTLDSFLMQETDFPFEIFVHDDASTDDSAKIIREYEKKYPKIIKAVYETENQYSKKNNSLRKITWSEKNNRGKYISLCEGDDYWIDSQKLQKQFDFLENNPEYSIVTGNTQVINENGEFIRVALAPRNSGEFNLDEYCTAPHTSTYFFRNYMHPTYMDCLKKFQQNFALFKGWDKSLLLFCLSMGKMYYIDEFMSAYRYVTSNGSNWTSQMYRVNKTKIIADVEKNMLSQVKAYQLNLDIRPHFYNNVILYALKFFIKTGKFSDFVMVLYAIRVCPSKLFFVFWAVKKTLKKVLKKMRLIQA